MPPKPGAISLHRLDDLVGVLRVEADRERVDAGELLEEHRLALHHRHRGARADVAEPEHRGAVADDGDRVALDRVLEGLLGVRRRSPCRRARRPACTPSRGRRASSAACLLRCSILPPTCIRNVRSVVVEHVRARRSSRSPSRICVPVVGVARVDGDVAHQLARRPRRGRSRRSCRRPRRSRSATSPEHAGAVLDLDADREAVLALGGRWRHGSRRSTLAERRGPAASWLIARLRRASRRGRPASVQPAACADASSS